MKRRVISPPVLEQLVVNFEVGVLADPAHGNKDNQLDYSTKRPITPIRLVPFYAPATPDSEAAVRRLRNK